METMTSITFKISETAPKQTADSMSIYAVGLDGKETKLQGAATKQAALKTLNLNTLRVSGAFESSARVQAGSSVLGLIGIGTGITSHSKAREVGGAIGRAFSDVKTLTIEIPLSSNEIAVALLEGIAIVQYDYTSYKSGENKPTLLKTVNLVTSKKVTKADTDRIKVLADVLNATRDLVNAPANDLYPAKMAEIVKSQSKIPGVTVEIWDEKKLAKEKCHGILAVGQGSVKGPRLVKITYKPAKSKAHLALVGKGITFDTGGISLKPATGILGMKYDMAGAATVAQAALAIARLGLPIAVTAFMCIAENMPSSDAHWGFCHY